MVTRAKYQRNPASTSSTPRLPRSTPRWVGQKGSKARSTGVFESLLFLFVGEMLILMPFVHHHQRSRIPLNKPTMSGSVCHMSFTATQDPYDPARGKTTVPRTDNWVSVVRIQLHPRRPRTPCVATQERIVHNCTYPLDEIVLTLPLPLLE